MENTWGGSMMAGEKSEPGTAGGEYAGAEGSAAPDSNADPNYMYGSHTAHNGAGAGEGY